jgi:hypothetical protein
MEPVTVFVSDFDYRMNNCAKDVVGGIPLGYIAWRKLHEFSRQNNGSDAWKNWSFWGRAQQG